MLVGRSTILPEGSPGFPDGGWIANKYSSPVPNCEIRNGNLACIDAAGLENGRTYWYAVMAVARTTKNRNSPTRSAFPRTPGRGGPQTAIDSKGDPPAVRPAARRQGEIKPLPPQGLTAVAGDR